MNQPGKSPLHPVVLIAAIAVTLLCLTGIAAMMGWLPASRSSPADTPVAAASVPLPDEAPSTAIAPPPTAEAPARVAPATARPASSTRAAATAPTAAATQEAPAQVAVARCTDCGVIESIHTLTQKGQGTGIGAVGGAVVGGVLGNQVGEGNGKRIARIGGAVLGGLAGNEVEKRARSETTYQINIRMDDGSMRTVTQKSAPAWQQGQRVHVSQKGAISAASS